MPHNRHSRSRSRTQSHSASDYHTLLPSQPPAQASSSSTPSSGTPLGTLSPAGYKSESFANLAPPTASFSAESRTQSDVSLSINYLPHKFSTSLLSPSPLRKRKKKGKGDEVLLPKRGGGVDAFRAGEARMPLGMGEDEGEGKVMRWNRFKWALFFSNLVLTIYSLTTLLLLLLTHFNVFTNADIIRVGNRPELILSTLASSLALFTSMIGWSGILLNNRSFLAVYTFLLWIVLGLIAVPGYITYRKRAFNLEGKINLQWSRDLGALGRLRIQNELNCCGYYSPFVEATISSTCYSRSPLPGCKLAFLQFERRTLERWYTAAFILVPIQIGCILAGLLCSNHVTYRFGKGMMPERYRLDWGSVGVILENYANQLAEQYGPTMASEILARSRSNLHLDTYASTQTATPPPPIPKYSSTPATTSPPITNYSTPKYGTSAPAYEGEGAHGSGERHPYHYQRTRSQSYGHEKR